MSDEDTKKAFREAILAHLDRMKAAHDRRYWALNDCPHVNTTELITHEATHYSCDDCGAERTDFVLRERLPITLTNH